MELFMFNFENTKRRRSLVCLLYIITVSSLANEIGFCNNLQGFVDFLKNIVNQFLRL